jgi:hypothetical protein
VSFKRSVSKIKRSKKKKKLTLAHETRASSSLLDVLGPAASADPVPPSSSGIIALRSAESIGDDIEASGSEIVPGDTKTHHKNQVLKQKRK